MQALFATQTATLEARERTGQNISVQVKAGKRQVVRLEKVGRKTEVIALSNWIDGCDVIPFLNSL